MKRQLSRPLEPGILPGCLDGLGYNFDPNDFLSLGADYLGNGTSAAVKVIDYPKTLTGEIPDNAKQPFGAVGVGLEKGEGGDPEGEPQDPFRDVIITPKDVESIGLYGICLAVIDGMEDAFDAPHKLQLLKPRYQLLGDPASFGMWSLD